MLIVGWFALVTVLIVWFFARACRRFSRFVVVGVSAAAVAFIAACAAPAPPVFGSGAWAGYVFDNQLGRCGDSSVPSRFKERGCYD